jgi:acylphosphatase
MRQEAERLGLTGWVRNRVDGEVEAVAQGGEAWQGPPAAHVARVECSAPAAEYERSYARFERWPTA